jgi:aldehyde:ferredoxin oxidoreductase
MNPDLIVPGPQGRPVSRKGVTLDRNDFEQLKIEYYRLRGWDAETGLPTEDKLKALGLTDVAADLNPYGGSPADT